MFVNKSENKIERPETLNTDYNLSVDYLIQLMDCPYVQLDYSADKSKAEIGEVIIFMRSLYGNYIVASESSGNSLMNYSIYTSEGKPRLPKEMTLNDYVLLSCRDILRCLFKGTPDTDIALNAFPTPFGIIHDTEKGCDVAIIQLCVNVEVLAFPDNSDFHYIPIEESKLPEYITKHFKYTKNKEDK